MHRITSILLADLLMAPLAFLHAAEVAKPRLSWVLEERNQETSDKGQKQTF